ncbi:agamous-like MADS-box protein AGL61 [Eucalyptus grandis]|uniref:agamous-like MADS-box protein AGL61 n=1 Tax=Eucalyptus grandis TaxID=71139 RepID=UPI00192EC0EB|nr:agamous-like MADS-box protein AGL61 [Eucalyptus grandis]
MAGRQTGENPRPGMKQIENESSRLITFSKRKSSINKKASELVTLCGAEAKCKQLNQQHDELYNQIKAEKAQGKALKRLTKGKSDAAWWEAPIEELNREELYQMKGRMEELRRSLKRSINQKTQGEASGSSQGQELEK